MRGVLLQVETRLEELVSKVNDHMDRMDTVETIMAHVKEELAEHELDDRMEKLIDIADELDD